MKYEKNHEKNHLMMNLPKYTINLISTKSKRNGETMSSYISELVNTDNVETKGLNEINLKIRDLSISNISKINNFKQSVNFYNKMIEKQNMLYKKENKKLVNERDNIIEDLINKTINPKILKLVIRLLLNNKILRNNSDENILELINGFSKSYKISPQILERELEKSLDIYNKLNEDDKKIINLNISNVWLNDDDCVSKNNFDLPGGL
jgi:flagellar hook-associated protein FlgK